MWGGSPHWFKLLRTLTIGFPDLGFEEWQARDGDPSLLMRDFHYTKPMSGAGPKEVYCQGPYFIPIHVLFPAIADRLSNMPLTPIVFVYVPLM